MIALDLDYEHGPVMASASEVESDRFAERGEARKFGSHVGDLHDFPLRRQKDIDKVYEHIAVPLLAEHCLEPCIGKYIDIPPDFFPGGYDSMCRRESVC